MTKHSLNLFFFANLRDPQQFNRNYHNHQKKIISYHHQQFLGKNEIFGDKRRATEACITNDLIPQFLLKIE